MLETCNLFLRSSECHFTPGTEDILADQCTKQPARSNFSEDTFSSPSQWWDFRNSKSYPISTNLKHNTQQFLRKNPCLVQEELGRRGLQPTEKEQDGEPDLEEEKQETSKVEGPHYHKQQEEVKQEALFLSDHQPHVLEEDYTSQGASIVALLKACTEQDDLHRGFSIHAHIVGTGLHEKNVFVGSSLINMYAKCGVLEKAQEVFDRLPIRNVISWNALIG
eukprot:c24234_g19_i1 orf=3-662(-)